MTKKNISKARSTTKLSNKKISFFIIRPALVRGLHSLGKTKINLTSSNKSETTKYIFRIIPKNLCTVLSHKLLVIYSTQLTSVPFNSNAAHHLKYLQLYQIKNENFDIPFQGETFFLFKEGYNG